MVREEEKGAGEGEEVQGEGKRLVIQRRLAVRAVGGREKKCVERGKH